MGGDDLLGLKITEKDANITVGDIVVGRESGSFLGKVSTISFFKQSNSNITVAHGTVNLPFAVRNIVTYKINKKQINDRRMLLRKNFCLRTLLI